MGTNKASTKVSKKLLNFRGRIRRLTKSDSARGGRAKSERKTLANQLKSRKKCNSSCPIFPCPVQVVSSTQGNKCVFNTLSHEKRRLILRYFTMDKSEHILALNQTMSKLAFLTGSANRVEQRELAKTQIDHIKTLHGEKQEISGTLGTEPSASSFASAYSEYKRLKELEEKEED